MHHFFEKKIKEGKLSMIKQFKYRFWINYKSGFNYISLTQIRWIRLDLNTFELLNTQFNSKWICINI